MDKQVLEKQLLDERRESWRTDIELPLKWCRLPGLVDADTLAQALGLTEWFRQDRVLAELDVPLAAAMAEISDPAAATAVRLLDSAVKALASTRELEACGAPTPINLSADGVCFEVAEGALTIAPQEWMGVCLTLPEGYPVMACLEVVWVSEHADRVQIGGRFHHVYERAAKKVSRYLMLASTH